MDLQLAGRTALVTGAGRGIGLATATALLDEGARVIGCSRTPTDGAAALLREHPAFSFVVADLTEPDAAADLVAGIDGPVHVLVNNVGAAPAHPQGFASIDDAMWRRSLELNLLAAVRMCRAAFDRIPDGGAIVTVASVNSTLPDPLVMEYSAAKAGLLGFSKALSKELGPRGIRVNTISPGPVATELWLGPDGVAQTVGRERGITPEEVERGAAGQAVTGRFTRPEEVAELIVVLASPRFANLTGADLVLDGGLRPTI